MFDANQLEGGLYRIGGGAVSITKRPLPESNGNVRGRKGYVATWGEKGDDP